MCRTGGVCADARGPTAKAAQHRTERNRTHFEDRVFIMSSIEVSVSFCPFTPAEGHDLVSLAAKRKLRFEPTSISARTSEISWQHSFACLFLHGFDVRPRGCAPDSQLVLAHRDEMIAIGSKGQLRDRFLVPIER